MLEHLISISQPIVRGTVRADDDLIARGLNANRALSIIKALWLETGIELDVNIFYDHRSLREIAVALESGRPPQPAKILTLRTGDASRPLFVYAGGVNCFLETRELIRQMAFDGEILGLTLTNFRRMRDNPATVNDEVEMSYAALKHRQPHGPYRLAGYSFGGVFALELARKIRSFGDSVDVLCLVDPPQNDHSWSWPAWAGLMGKILKRQLRSRFEARRNRDANRRDAGPVADRPASDALARSPPRKGHQLTFRFRDPRHSDYPVFAPQWAGSYPPAYDAAARQLLQMKGLYRPAVFPDPVLFIHAKSGSPIDCDSRRIWAPYLPQADWVCVAGNHLSMIVGRNARAPAACMDLRLARLPKAGRQIGNEQPSAGVAA